MTNNARIVDKNWSDDATISAITSEAGDFVKGNLQNTQPQSVWRSTSAVAQVIDFDLGNEQGVRALVLYNTNLSIAATVKLEGASDSGFTTIVSTTTKTPVTPKYGWGEFPWGNIGWGGYDEDDINLTNYSIIWITLTSARYWRLTITDTTNADGYVEIGRLIIGDYISPAINVEYGYSLNWIDPSEQSRTRGSAIRSTNITPFRRVTFSYQFLDQTEAFRMHELKRDVGKRKDILFSLVPEEDTARERINTLLGRPVEWSSLLYKSVNRHEQEFTIEESI